jgi:hypothetical protein
MRRQRAHLHHDRDQRAEAETYDHFLPKILHQKRYCLNSLSYPKGSYQHYCYLKKRKRRRKKK